MDEMMPDGGAAAGLTCARSLERLPWLAKRVVDRDLLADTYAWGLKFGDDGSIDRAAATSTCVGNVATQRCQTNAA